MGASAWISRGFEELVHELGNKREARERPWHYDVVVVGSGYGGAVAAAGLAGCAEGERRISVCVLERGKEYLRGMFPSTMAELAGHVRFSAAGSARPRGQREGLFDVRVGPDACAVLASGLGGGSLINAGVMEEPDAEVFADPRWPEELRDPARRRALYDEARKLVGAADEEGANTILRQKERPPAKFRALQALAGTGGFRPAAISVAMEGKRNGEGVALERCIRCGDCATGCNYGAKESLDLNLLARAWRGGAELFTGATVLRIERDERAQPPAWVLTVVHTDEKLRRREIEPLELRAKQVVLAAGAFGTPEILMRSRSDALEFSPRLGQGFSANGDMIAVAYGQGVEANALADESVAPERRGVGPTITGILELRRAGARHLVEELAVPGPLRRAFEEIVTTARTLHELQREDERDHDPASPSQRCDPCAVDPDALRRSSVLAVMGRDDRDGAGSLELSAGAGEEDGDGAVSVRWPELRTARLFRDQIAALQDAVKASTGGAILPSPLWQLLPERMQFLLDNERGPLLTVHPLGGCALGANAGEGVVDPLGRVFDAADKSARATLPGLVVLDGSMVPGALGTNPALTITVLALRAVRALRREWGYSEPRGEGRALPERRAFREPPAPRPPRPTELEFRERMSGRATLAGAGGKPLECVVELTLPFRVCSAASLVRPQDGTQAPMKRALEVLREGPRRGELRVFRAADWLEWRRQGEPESAAAAIVQAHAYLGGTLSFLHREARTRRSRTCTALRAWFWNRGLRDTWQWIAQRWRQAGLLGFLTGAKEAPGAADDPSGDSLLGDIRRRWEGAVALASRGGEARLLEYELEVGEVLSDRIGLFQRTQARSIRGLKRLTYARRSNPWRQLMRMSLLAFPGLASSDAPPVLELDAKYLAREHVPLFRIAGQHDQPSALADLASLGAWLLRVLLNIHIWSFRRPDAPEPREPQRLPGIVAGLPEPQIKELDVDRLPDGTPVRVRLTRYRPAGAKGRPVVLIHGYSASGTTFAHPAVRPNLAEYLCGARRDVWILDLRTSSGMPTARLPWTFEDAALQDLPAAFAHIRRETGGKLDVVAHCMGAAMLSMAVLKPPEPGERYFREREALPGWIRRAVLSQIGPVVVMSPANIFRAYALSYLRYFLPFAGYDFRVKDDPGLLDQLIDRFLATQPYPESEFDVENPPWPPCRRTPFAGTRHRMDALYGRDFSLADASGRPRLSDAVLESIDDLFGPLSIDTVAQGLHFARLQTIATRAGRNEYVHAESIRARWTFPTLSLHGEENGLADVATLTRIREKMVPAGANFTTRAFPGFGHQDSLIGVEAPQVFEAVAQFLEEGAS